MQEQHLEAAGASARPPHAMSYGHELDLTVSLRFSHGFWDQPIILLSFQVLCWVFLPALRPVSRHGQTKVMMVIHRVLKCLEKFGTLDWLQGRICNQQ